MTSDQDWRERIDQSFGDGPGHRPVTERLAAGRRAVRRRRVVVGAAAVALTVVAGGTAWAAQPSETGTGAPVAGNPDGQTVHKADPPADDGELVTMTDSGWKVASGWNVDVRYINPMHYEPPKRSVGMEIVNGSERRVLLAVYDGQCCTSVRSEPATVGMIHEWLDGAVAAQTVRDGGTDHGTDDQPVRFGPGETLVAAPGVTILEQLPHPDLPANFAGDDDRSAAARIDDHGKTTFVLVREIAGEEQVIPYAGSFESLDKFLDFAKRKYESGVGLL